MPGTAAGAVARKPRKRAPGTRLRVVRNATTSASAVPTVADMTPKRKVLERASCVAEKSVKTKRILRKVTADQVKGSVAVRTIAAFNSAPYGKRIGSDTMANANRSAGQRQRPNCWRRGAPLLLPITV